MSTIRLQATIQETDLPYLERFLKGISATEVSFEEEEDYFDILTPKDLQDIALSKEQGNLGMVTKNEDVFKSRREKILLKFNSSKVQNKNLFSNTKGLWFIINN